MFDGSAATVHDLDEEARKLGYPDACERFKLLKQGHAARPSNLAETSVMQAWMEVLAIEARLLHWARVNDVGEAAAHRLFMRRRGRGIPASPQWQAMLVEAGLCDATAT